MIFCDTTKFIQQIEISRYSQTTSKLKCLWRVLLYYSQTTSKLKCVGSPCRIIYTVFGKPPVSLLKLFDYNYQIFSGSLKAIQAKKNAH